MQKTADLTGRIPVTLDDDLPDAEGTVLGCFVTLGALCAAQADGSKAESHLKLLGKGTAHVFISDARGELTCYDKAFTWQPDGLWPGSTDGAWPSVGASVARVASSKNGARLRVDLEIEISGALFQAQSFDALCGVELGEEYDDSDGPALYIYYARQKGASLTLPGATMPAPVTWPPPTIWTPTVTRRRSLRRTPPVC